MGACPQDAMRGDNDDGIALLPIIIIIKPGQGGKAISFLPPRHAGRLGRNTLAWRSCFRPMTFVVSDEAWYA
jgi:hypothetical protein